MKLPILTESDGQALSPADRRRKAMVYDTTIVFGGFAVISILSAVGMALYVFTTGTTPVTMTSDGAVIAYGANHIMGALAMLLVPGVAAPELFGGQSPGKRLARCQIRTTSGDLPNRRALWFRWLIKSTPSLMWLFIIATDMEQHTRIPTAVMGICMYGLFGHLGLTVGRGKPAFYDALLGLRVFEAEEAPENTTATGEMSGFKKVCLGLGTLWVPVYSLLFITMWLGVATGAVQPDERIVAVFVIHGLTMIVTLALLAVYVLLVVKNEQITPSARPVWFALLLFGGAVMMPAYYFMYVVPLVKPRAV